MVLSPAQGMRFFRLFDSVVEFANARLGLGCDLGANRGVRDAAEQLEVVNAICANPEVLQEYAVVNPSRLSAADLKTALTWQEPLPERFPYCVRPNGDVELLFEEHIIQLVGLSREVSGMLKSDIGFVDMTLLPFDDAIVYASSLSEFDVAIGAGLASMFDEWFDEARSEGRFIRTAEEYLAVVPQLKARRDEREARELIEDAEYDLNPPTEFPGVHRGALADLSHEERDRRVEAEVRRSMLEDGDLPSIEERLRSQCVKSARCDDFFVLAVTEKNALLESFLRALGARRSSGMNKKQLVAAIAELLERDASGLIDVFEDLEPNEFARLKRVYDAGGVLTAEFSEIDSLKEFPMRQELMCYLFDEGGSVACVIPDAILDAMRRIDLSGVAERFQNVERARNVADKLVETRGMLTFDEAFDEFRRMYPASFDAKDFVSAITKYCVRDMQGFELFVDKETHEIYLVHWRLISELQDADESLQSFSGMNSGNLGFLKDLLAVRAGKQPWQLPESLVAAESYFDWALGLPSARTFAQFLNENVPDGENDLFFADGVMEVIIDEGSAGAEPTALVQYLADRGLAFEDMRHENKMIGLLFALINDLPRWDNNGWPAAELHAATAGVPEFRNPDGSVMKVGRNDPCPCGSGKKYKKCCGR